MSQKQAEASQNGETYQEKVFMERLRCVGHAVGEYVGGGKGDMEQEETEVAGEEGETENEDRDDVLLTLEDDELVCDGEEEQEEEDSIENAHPLLFFFDLNTTGLNIYEDHIVEIAAKVVGAPLSRVTQPSFSSLVHTPRNIPSKGMLYTSLSFSTTGLYGQLAYTVTQKTGISATMLRHELPLSAISPKFLGWLSATTQERSEGEVLLIIQVCAVLFCIINYCPGLLSCYTQQFWLLITD